MFYISSCSTAAPRRWASRSYYCWTIQHLQKFPPVSFNESVGLSWKVSRSFDPGTSGKVFAATYFLSSKSSCSHLGLSTARPVWHRGYVESQEAFSCRPTKNQNQRPSLSVALFCSSWLVHGSEGIEKLGLRSNFHTPPAQEGRYICDSFTSPHEEKEVLDACSDKSGVVIAQECDSAGGAEKGNTPGALVKTIIPEIWVVNFYHFVTINDPHLEVARHTTFLEGSDVRGRIYISYQGINAQLSGRGKEAIEYAEWVKEDSRFSNMLVQISPSPNGHAFPRLRLRYKPSLVQVEGGTLHLPITDPSNRAVHLTPREWIERLDGATIVGNNEEFGSLKDGVHGQMRILTSNIRRPVVLLDVRNGYEWDVGHFKGAQRPDVDCFKDTEFGFTENKPVSRDPLANVDKEAVDVMMYCTGGIRCDVFSAILRQKGFKNLYTLKGGVSHYLKEEGSQKWIGNLFVFDSRLAVSPKVYHSKEFITEDMSVVKYVSEESLGFASLSTLETFARCRWCEDSITEPRHRNCANLECNLLYLSCEGCILQHRGCCSYSCSSAPKVRPLLMSQQYDRWHKYRPLEHKPLVPEGYVSRRAMKRRRRKERRKQLEGVPASEDSA